VTKSEESVTGRGHTALGGATASRRRVTPRCDNAPPRSGQLGYNRKSPAVKNAITPIMTWRHFRSEENTT